MDLYSGLPYWIAKNPLNNYYNPLMSNYETDVVIIGSGITGSLTAHELCKAGIKCCVVDKRGIAQGSSSASTAQLQYEIDTPLSELIEKIRADWAVRAYESSLKSIYDLEKVFEEIDFDPDFKRVSSIFYASDRKGKRLIEKEYNIRQKYNLPVEYLSRRELHKSVGIRAHGALKNNEAAQMDTYSAAVHLLDYHNKYNDLEVFTNTNIINYKETKKGYVLLTENDHKIKCKYLIIAAGFEAVKFLPKKVMNLVSTYVIISENIDEKYFWPEESLIWETKQPYLYVRTSGKRIIVGGEDVNFRDPVRRDRLLRNKAEILENKFHKLFPDIPFKTDMTWCGTFSSTEDGLPYIGFWPGKERMFFALGYGGNGITFSMIAAQVIKNKLKGIKDERIEIFGFNRLNNSNCK